MRTIRRHGGLLLTRSIPLESETAFFILVSVCDVIFTAFLLAGGTAFEANPIANWFIEGWGLNGMVGFKFGMIAFICLVVQMIAAARLHVARRILNFATYITGAVVLYSGVLLLIA
ncbi:DUF5658 family protein [Stratiformator vulcanicus]|uniref:DUF5658 domain-containing protein n=1 Tax=Stratiformator vulcanicus TaxID=2527980 RepID=A0A517QZ82_9PLAN|nr:DUF5658 family protein [Stratiformator vulcanicus]QDT36957.1 hypothetical protein Pan189_13210 [Stratiformator vulcanicus]